MVTAAKKTDWFFTPAHRPPVLPLGGSLHAKVVKAQVDVVDALNVCNDGRRGELGSYAANGIFITHLLLEA